MNPINFLEKLQIIFFIRNPSTIWQKEKIKFMRNTRKPVIEVIGIGGEGFNTPPPSWKLLSTPLVVWNADGIRVNM